MNPRDSIYFQRALCSTLVLIVWALWFGGIMGLFLSVQVLFHQTDRPIFLASAPKLFIAFERYQLLLAGAALIVTLASGLLAKQQRWRLLFALFTTATIGAIVETTLITPRIEAMRIAGQTHTPHFLQLHGLSMCVYMAVAITLLVAGILQCLQLQMRQTTHEPLRATILPAGAAHRSRF